MDQPTASTRREFLQTTSAATVAGSLALNASLASSVYAAGDDTLKIGLVGCGGRGTGAANQALHADKNVKLVAVADVFRPQLDYSIENLKSNAEIADKVQVDEDHKFVGLDAYKSVVDACDVVLLATPPGFRPVQLRYAVEQNKHIFTEKPMATDAPGCRSVMESVKLAKEKKLGILAGFCWRYDYPRRELFKRIHEGQIGDVVSIYGTYLTNPVKPMPAPDTRPDGITDLEWMVRNWYNFVFLSGDGLVEQAIHTVDWLAWVMKDHPPAAAVAVGGRQIPQEGGNIWDHIEVNYEWDNDLGTRGFLAQRQISGCHNENGLIVQGTKGTAHIGGRGVQITGENPWKYMGDRPDMYQVEHNEFFASLREGKPLNDGDRMVTSTLMGIQGRMAGYTGRKITWEMAMNSQEVLVPEIKDWNTEVKVPPTAQPGITQFS
ncbi:twin-arginine translocation signal domain-containing protein [bacterium]|nr:twin-arginine translocation signal domain-containing protein [bacterium]